MRISIFSHDSNPSVDRPILRKSVLYCVEEAHRGNGFFLPDHRGFQLYPPKTEAELAAHEDNDHRLSSADSTCSISAKESVKNAVFDPNSRENHWTVVRAHKKFKAWPHIGDTKAVRVGIRP